MDERTIQLIPVGRVESTLTELASVPSQGDEGGPNAWVVFEVKFRGALDGLRPGDEVVLVTWLDRARRDVLCVHPRGDPSRPEQGVFTTRSPDRPNPIGLHRVEILAIEDCRIRVGSLEALDGTPVIDVKPVLSSNISER